LGFGGWLIVLYLAVTRIGHLEAAKLGVQIGPVPLFLTEILVISTLLTAILTRPTAMICWVMTGGLAGICGSLLWLLMAVSILYAGMAIQNWGVLALRDLAVFSYGMMFAIAYILLDSPQKAATAMRWFTYSGVVLAIGLIVDTATGAHLFFSSFVRIMTEERLAEQSFGGGDVGGIVSFSMMAVIAYAITTPRLRTLNIFFAVICFYALVIGQTRSAVFGVAVSSLYCFIGLRTVQRVTIIAVCVAAVLIVVAIPILMPTSGMAITIQGFVAAVQGGAALSHDDDFYFRLLRWDAVINLWRQNPLFGVGFGQPLIPASLLNAVEIGGFNAGLPHNTYLTVLARMGLFGCLLIVVPWLICIGKALQSQHRALFGADTFAAGAALVAMSGFACFVLFLERPMHAATLWIVAAITCRLAQPDPGISEPTAIPTAASSSRSIIARAQRIGREKWAH
jgi:O-antigen ligase